MFDFQEELKYYEKCLEAENPGEGMSGEEMRDIMDILRAMQPVKSEGEKA